MSYLQQLLQQGAAGTGGVASASDPLSILMQTISGSDSTSDPTNSAAGSTSSLSLPPFGTGTMAALISLQGQSANGLVAQSPSQLFSKIDTDGDGKISKTEFENALSGAGVSTSDADAAFAKLDANGDGSITHGELPGTKGAHGHHHAHGGGGSDDGDQDPLSQLISGAGADGATTQTATNADGSTTTTITYADGTTIDMTSPGAPTNSGQSGAGTDGNSSNSANSQNNLLQDLIKLQSQMLTAATSTLSTIA